MNTRANIEGWMNKIENIRYDNPHGGSYAYVQYLAYARELGKFLRPIRQVDRQVEKIEAVCWLFNEYLGASFTQRQHAIFDDQMSVTRDTLEQVRQVIKGLDLNLIYGFPEVQRQAA